MLVRVRFYLSNNLRSQRINHLSHKFSVAIITNKAYVEDTKNNQEVNYDLPENPISLQIAKFEICQEILGYKLQNNLTREQVAAKMDLSKAETEDILFGCIEKFTLDRLVKYASRLLDPVKVKVVLEPRKPVIHAETI